MSADEDKLAALVNTARMGRARKLVIGWRIARAARKQAAVMAKDGKVEHGTLGWTGGRACWGQNVGQGATVAEVQQAFMDSPDHRANILNDCFRYGGYGVVAARGTLWVVENFSS